MVARAQGVPVLFACETCKFHERVQLDSICNNELGDPETLVSVPDQADVRWLEGWADVPQLRLLNLLYDATPMEFVTAIITEARRRGRPAHWNGSIVQQARTLLRRPF